MESVIGIGMPQHSILMHKMHCLSYPIFGGIPGNKHLAKHPDQVKYYKIDSLLACSHSAIKIIMDYYIMVHLEVGRVGFHRYSPSAGQETNLKSICPVGQCSSVLRCPLLSHKKLLAQ